MRYKRTRSGRKYLQYLERRENFRKPYQVLVEDTFLDNFNRYKHSMHSFKLLMHSEPKFFISECCYKVYKKTHMHDNDFIKHCKIKGCPYQCESSLKCMLGILRKRNRHHFFVATASPQIIDRLAEACCVPVITVSKGGLCFATKSKHNAEPIVDNEDCASDTNLRSCAVNKHCSE
eukprot:jgi/Antlo1/54/948